MKNLILLHVALFAIAGFCNAQSSENTSTGNAEEIVITKDVKPGEETPVRTRSAVPDVSAYVDHELAQLEIEFNTCIGMARIQIVDGSGRCVHSSVCDSEMVPVVWISLPSAGDSYILRIDTSSAVYSATFSL